jgi:uncharacterized protein (TIGR02588 family)
LTIKRLALAIVACFGFAIVAALLRPVDAQDRTAERLSDLETKVAALETRVSSGDARPIPTATRSSQSSSPLSIKIAGQESTGIGDGSFYVYVDVTNNSSNSYQFVFIDGTCRGASGQVVDTTLGSTENLNPGETDTVTLIFLNGRNCEKIEVDIDSAS